MRSLAIITKKHKPDAWDAGQALMAWLEGRGLEVTLLENEPEPQVPLLPAGVELIVVTIAPLLFLFLSKMSLALVQAFNN